MPKHNVVGEALDTLTEYSLMLWLRVAGHGLSLAHTDHIEELQRYKMTIQVSVDTAFLIIKR